MASASLQKNMNMPWLSRLKRLVERKPIAILTFHQDEWKRLEESRRGVNEFTVVHSHELLKDVKAPTPCLMRGKSDDSESLYFGLIGSRSAVATMQSRIKVRRVVRIQPRSSSELIGLVTEKTHATNLKVKLFSSMPVIALSPQLSSHLVERLASIDTNSGAMRAVEASLSAPRHFQGAEAMQEDAVRAALTAFGLSPTAHATSLELVAGRETALARVGIWEDSVIEHDARSIPGYDLVQSDLTGRAIFERGSERLEVFTANRRPLEHYFGIDLIYLNASRQSIVMPIDHFEQLRGSPACRGPKNGLRVSYESLSGRYLRRSAFLDLIRSGYIGAHAETTGHIKALIEAVLQDARAVVAAIQQSMKLPLAEEDT